MSKKFSVLLSLIAAAVPLQAHARSCTGLGAGQARVVSELQALGYTVQCGSISFPVNSNGTCTNGAVFSPNPSSCYGSYSIPPRAGGADSPLYKLDNDEAIVLVGDTPPSAYYFGVESYVFSRSNPLAKNPATSYVDIYSSVGPAINQRTVSALTARSEPLEQMFSEYVALISTANPQTYSDFRNTALPYLFSASPKSAAVSAAQEITNLEMLPVDLIELGTTGNTDNLNTFVRYTPFTVAGSTTQFNAAAVSYMQKPGSLILRISPTTPRTTDPLSDYYTLAQDPMPPTKIESGVVWEQSLLDTAGVSNGAAALTTIAANVTALLATQGLSPIATLNLGNGVTALSNTQGRSCLAQFEANVASGSASAVADTPTCAADSADADYVGINSSQLVLPPGGQVVVIGINHGTLGSGTYSNVSLQDPTADVAALTNLDLAGSAAPYLAGIPSAAANDFYVATVQSSCAGLSYCMEAPASSQLRLGERDYLAPLTGTKPDYTDLIYPMAIVFAP